MERRVKSTNASAENYYNIAKGNDDQAMLDAAEKLHADYEMMVRTLKPCKQGSRFISQRSLCNIS